MTSKLLTRKKDTLLRIAQDSTKYKSLKNIDIGTKAKVLLSGESFLEEGSNKFRTECLRYYTAVAEYLLEHLPIDIKTLQHTQFLHHEKRDHPGVINAFSNLGLKFTKVGYK